MLLREVVPLLFFSADFGQLGAVGLFGGQRLLGMTLLQLCDFATIDAAGVGVARTVYAGQCQADAERVREAAAGVDAQIKKIRALWLELHRLGAVRSPSELSLARFVSRMTGVDYQGWLSVDDASRVIEHLKKWKKRVEGRSV